MYSKHLLEDVATDELNQLAEMSSNFEKAIEKDLNIAENISHLLFS